MSDCNKMNYLKGKPMVSICCITYNHEPYIRDCLEGFMMQKTSFPFEVLIHDDASTDHTADIIREYEAKYPDIIKPIYQTENQYSKGVSINRIFNYSRAQGKYIARCEGDDYWIDPLKLQKQFDFMEKNPDYSICGCRSWHRNEIQKTFWFPKDIGTIEETFHNGINTTYLLNKVIDTSSIFFRVSCYEMAKEKIIRDTFKMPFGDIQFRFHLSQYGPIKVLSDRMMVYRINPTSAMGYSDPVKRKTTLLRMLAGHVALARNNGCYDSINSIIDCYAIQIIENKTFAEMLKQKILASLMKYAKTHKIYIAICKLSVDKQLSYLASQEKSKEIGLEAVAHRWLRKK